MEKFDIICRSCGEDEMVHICHEGGDIFIHCGHCGEEEGAE